MASNPVYIFEEGQYDAIREAGRLAGEVLHLAGAMIKPGVLPTELDEFAEDWIIEQGCIPTFKGYHGFPATLCISANDQIVHGIPSDKAFKEGDIVSLDVGVTLTEKFNGEDVKYVGDNAFTFACGELSSKTQQLLIDTNRGLWAGLDQIKAGNKISDITKAIEEIAKEKHYGNVADYGGHGIGPEYHCEPFIPNFTRYFDTVPDTEIEVGMVLAVEPMFNLGSSRTKVMKDKWTVVTEDRKNSAHFEHSVLVKKDGVEIITNTRNTRDILQSVV